ncbi:MAG: hypothetical protein KGL21_04085 [Alphaproteobacteria bacterium]|nr:hypothetical protein [Alphaproteobacteria bacterium]
MRLHFSILVTLIGTTALTTPLMAKTTVQPYLEVDQSVYAPLDSGNGPAETTTTLAAGVDISASNRRTQAQIDARVEEDLGWQTGAPRVTTFSGLGRVDYALVPQTLTLDVGGIGTRSNLDIRGNALNSNPVTSSNLSQIYSIYAGPTLTTHRGDLNIGASYRIGYTKIEDSTNPAQLPTGQPPLDVLSHSVDQIAMANVGMRSGVLPFGWNLSAAYARDDAEPLNQSLIQEHVRGDVTVPVSNTTALVGGVGYEKVKAEQQAPLLDANGNPILDANGGFQTDPASPKLPYYDLSDVYWDAGVAWRPSAHTYLEARAGRRYGSWSFTGTFASQLDPYSSVSINAYDEIDTFGSQLDNSLAALPTSFQAVQNPFNGQYNGCVYGGQNGGTGGCVSGALQSISASVYRTRGVNLVYATQQGLWGYGVAGGYARRDFLTPVTGALGFLNGSEDQNAFIQAYLSRRLSPHSEFDANLYGNWYKSGIVAAPSVTSFGASGTYQHSFGNHLSGRASLGLFEADEQGVLQSWSAAALLGMRYQF